MGEQAEPRAHGHNHPVLPNHRRADLDIAAIRSLHRKQIALYQQEQKAIAAAVKYRSAGSPAKPLTDQQIQVLRVGLSLLSEPDLQRRMEAIDVALTRLTRGSLDAARSHEAIVGEQDDAALKATVREEFLRAAHTFTDEEWQLLDEVREIKRRDGARAAMLAARDGLRARTLAAGADEPQEDA